MVAHYKDIPLTRHDNPSLHPRDMILSIYSREPTNITNHANEHIFFMKIYAAHIPYNLPMIMVCWKEYHDQSPTNIDVKYYHNTHINLHEMFDIYPILPTRSIKNMQQHTVNISHINAQSTPIFSFQRPHTPLPNNTTDIISIIQNAWIERWGGNHYDIIYTAIHNSIRAYYAERKQHTRHHLLYWTQQHIITRKNNTPSNNPIAGPHTKISPQLSTLIPSHNIVISGERHKLTQWSDENSNILIRENPIDVSQWSQHKQIDYHRVIQRIHEIFTQHPPTEHP